MNPPPTPGALVQHGVERTLVRMAVPMLAGTFALNAYSLTDTWFVSRLGTIPLAAMGFTFPVVMLLGCVSGGLGVGATTLMSHAMGRGDPGVAARITTHGLLLCMCVALFFSIVGMLTMSPVFGLLGANAEVMPSIRDYMGIWFVGATFMALPFLGNGLLISAGDSTAAGRFMMLGPLANLVLDPLFIFGGAGIPAMGIRGAALATVIGQALSAAWLFLLLGRKHGLLKPREVGLRGSLVSTRQILAFGIPAILSMLLMPLSSTVITKLLSSLGNSAVAAVSAAQRLEMFAFVIPMALGMSLTPFVSQNFGAGRLDRIERGSSLANRFAMAYGAFIAFAFFFGARWLAALFSTEPEVAAIMVRYVRIVAFGYGFMEVHRYSGFVLTGIHKPVASALLNAVRVLGALVPLSVLGTHLWGLNGLFGARLVTDASMGILGIVWVRRVLRGARGENSRATRLES